MTQRCFSGFVLSSQALSDHKFVVNCYTAESGKRSAVLYTNRKVSRAYLTTLARLNFILTGKEHQDLPTMSEVSLESHRHEWASSYLGMALFQHWAYLVEASHVVGQEDERVYRLLKHLLASLGPDPRAQTGLPAINLYFEAWLLHFSGMLPRPNSNARISSGPPEAFSLGSKLAQCEMADARLHGDEPARLHDRIAPALLESLFSAKVDAFYTQAMNFGSLALSQETVGRMWELFLGRAIKTRPTLMALLSENKKQSFVRETKGD